MFEVHLSNRTSCFVWFFTCDCGDTGRWEKLKAMFQHKRRSCDQSTNVKFVVWCCCCAEVTIDNETSRELSVGELLERANRDRCEWRSSPSPQNLWHSHIRLYYTHVASSSPKQRLIIINAVIVIVDNIFTGSLRSEEKPEVNHTCPQFGSMKCSCE